MLVSSTRLIQTIIRARVSVFPKGALRLQASITLAAFFQRRIIMDATQTTQTVERSEENTTGVPELDRMITESLLEDATALYVGIEIERSNPKLAARIQAFIRNFLPEFFEQLRPQKIKEDESADVELDIMPASMWLRFLDGFKAATSSETGVDKAEAQEDKSESAEKGDPNLRTIKRWMQQTTYRERLTAILLLELLQKETEFDKPDNSIGNDLISQWRTEIIDAGGNSEFFSKTDAEEIAVTSATAMMIPWKV